MTRVSSLAPSVNSRIIAFITFEFANGNLIIKRLLVADRKPKHDSNVER